MRSYVPSCWPPCVTHCHRQPILDRNRRESSTSTSRRVTPTQSSIVNRQSAISPRPAHLARRAQRLSGSRAVCRSASTSRWRRGCRWRSSRTWRGARRPAARWRRWCRTSRRAWAASRRSRRTSSSACGRIVEAALAKGPVGRLAAHHPQPRLQDQRAGTPRGRVGAAGQVRALADDGAPGGGRRRGGAAAGRAGAGAHRLARRPAGDVSRRASPWAPGCGCLAPSPASPRPSRPRRHCHARRPPPTIAAGGTIRGAWSRSKASAPPASGRRPTPRAWRRWSPTPTRHGLWIRFYTLNGLAGEREGWTASYNFGSLDAAARRWRAAVDAKVDFIATDQYAEFARSRR